MKFKFESTLVIIPARGGSKRIPNKNIKNIFNQPMIYWPLMTLSNLFKSKNILVSTDSDQIISIVEAIGLKVPFKRPANLSDDFTITSKVVSHALKWYETNIEKVEFVLTVYPTAVMLSENDIVDAMKTLIEDPRCDTVMSATKFSFPIQRAIFKNCNGYAEMFEPNNYSTRSQDLVESMHDAGQFYLSRVKAVRNGSILTNSNVKIHLIHRSKVIDIDTFEDFEIAEDLLKLKKGHINFHNWTF